VFNNNDAQSVREHTQQRREKKNARARAHTRVCCAVRVLSPCKSCYSINLYIDDLRAGEITR